MKFPVNIRVYTFCYNNVLLLPFVIDYWKTFATKVVVYDNMSTDNSVSILRQYPWIEVRQFDTKGYYSPDTVQDLKNACYKECRGMDVDYVFVCDLDEFPLYGNNLMHMIAEDKKDGVRYYESEFYDMLGDRYPNYDGSLMQNFRTFKLVRNLSSKRIHLFDPEITVTFSEYGNNCQPERSDCKSSVLTVLHAQLFASRQFATRQQDYVKRLDPGVTDRAAVTRYGSNMFTCVTYTNNRHAQFYQQHVSMMDLLKPICSADYMMNIQKGNPQANYINNVVQVSMKVSGSKRIPWKPAKIQRYYSHDKTCVVAIPVYKTDITPNEMLSLRRVVEVLGEKHDLVLVGPSDLYFDNYSNQVGYKFSTLKCNPDFFTGTASYSMLCETAEFYETFSEYEYMLIYQLDGWIFRDEIRKFATIGFDYIGSPWTANSFDSTAESVGNGGVSWRNVSKFAQMCRKITDEDLQTRYQQLEDVFFCHYLNRKYPILNIADVETAVQFCLDGSPEYWIGKFRKMPMCAHAWEKRGYWKDKIGVEEKKAEDVTPSAKEIRLSNAEIRRLTNTEFKNPQNPYNKTAPSSNDRVMICIFNYKNDDNAKRWLYLMKPHFDTVVLDSGNDHEELEFTQFPNIYYSGLWNEAQNLCRGKGYRWVGIITSDVEIDDENAEKLIGKIRWLTTTTNIGQYQPSLNKQSAKRNRHQQPSKKLQSIRFIEGMITFMNYDMFSLIPYVDPQVNKYGMYIDNVLSAICLYNKMHNIYDNELSVYHPESTGYSKDERQTYMNWANKLKQELLGIPKISTNNAELKFREYDDPEITYMTSHDTDYNESIERICESIDIQYTYYTTDNIDKTRKVHPVYVTFTSWKKRISRLTKYWENLKRQSIQPDKYILWLSSDEVTEHDIPDELLNDEKLEIHWVDRNLKSFKKFLTIQQCPEAYNIILDDDRLYHKDTIKTLLDESKKCGDSKIIGYYCDECNSKGQPWGGIQGEDRTGIKWINDSCVLYPPYTFPRDVFDYYGKIMLKRELVSDECFIMPFIIRHKLEIHNITEGIQKLNKVSPLLDYQKSTALHTMFMTDGKVATCKKNQLIWDICQELPHDFYDAYKSTFPNFGDGVRTDYIIISMTTWTQRIQNIPHIINDIKANTMQPDKIIINLCIEDFPNMFEDIDDELRDMIEDSEGFIEINWLKNNTKVWKKVIPTWVRYPNALTISIDDDFKYPDNFIKTLYDEYVRNGRKYPVSGNHEQFFGMRCHCGCCSLSGMRFLKQPFNILNDEIMAAGSDDIFYSFCAQKNGNEYIQSPVLFFTNMPAYNATNPYSKGHKINLKDNYEKCMKSYNIMFNIPNNPEILVCIFNYRHDDNAKRLLHALSPHFETVVLDSGNDHMETEFTQFPNIFYSGLWNEMKKLADKKPYKYVMQICSDVEITDENMEKLIAKLNKLLTLDTIGIWQPASDMTSRKNWTVRVDTQHRYTLPSVIEGWMMVMSADVLAKVDMVDTTTNLYGYAIDILTSVRAKEMKKMLVIDNTVQVHNPAGTGYNTDLALKQGNAYLQGILKKKIHDYTNHYTHTPYDHIEGLD